MRVDRHWYAFGLGFGAETCFELFQGCGQSLQFRIGYGGCDVDVL